MKNKIKIESIKEENINGIISAYMGVFTAHPWHEEFKCSECGFGPYSFGCDEKEDCEEFNEHKLIKINSLEYQKCESCGLNLEETLTPIYTIDSVKENIIAQMKKEGFIGKVGIRIGEVSGFCWGFNYPMNHNPKNGDTWYLEAGSIIKNLKLNLEKSFYHNESATLKNHRKLGIGTKLLEKMLEDVKENNKDIVIFRTINPAMISCYEKVLGLTKNSLNPKFSDPDPRKRQNWYVLKI